MKRTRGFSSGLLLGVLLGAGFAAVLPDAVAWAKSDTETLYKKLDVLAQVLASVENHYVDAVGAQELVYGAARGAVSSLDEHSSFFSPEEYRRLLDATEGEYAGIGVELDYHDGAHPVVVTVLPESAAARAGVQTGDVLVSVDGAATANDGLDVLETKLRGPVGSKVALGIVRAGRDDVWTFTLVRAWVRVAPITHRVLEDQVDYVQLKSFSRRVAQDFEAILAREKGVKGMVLDLRGNPGGLFDEAVSVCDLFLKDGPIVSAVGRGGRIIERHEAQARGSEPDYRLAILIDKDSASAAEVVAGALADRGRARLFGTRSYGKGSVQSILDLPDGSGLKLTVARYFTPSGRQIDHHGIEPQVTIEPSKGADDPVLKAARAWVLGS